MTDCCVRYDISNDGIGEFVIERPKALNALNQDVLIQLLDALEQCASRVRVVILTGSGERAFVAGADIAAMSAMSREEIAVYVDRGQRVMRACEQYPVPIIAAVNGFALGGGLELALACDLIVAARTAKVGQPEVNLGIIPGFGGTQRLVHRCGLGVARRLVYTGEILTASDALALGVVDFVVEPSELMERARRLASDIAAKGPRAIRAAKSAMRESVDSLVRAGLDTEREEFLRVFATTDRAEGMRAFLEKRPARFTDA